MKGIREKLSHLFKLRRPVASGRNSLIFVVVTATVALLMYSSVLYLASTNEVLQEKSSEFALNGLVAGLGAAYPAVESALRAGLDDGEVLNAIGRPETADYRSGALLPFIIDNRDMQIVEESSLPGDLAAEIERACREGEYTTVQVHSSRATANICNVEDISGSWLAAIIPLPETGKGFGLASNTSGFIAHARKVERDLIGSLAFAYIYFIALLIAVLRIITRPLRNLTKVAKRYATGDFSARVEAPIAVAELEVLAEAFNSMGSELKRQHDSLEAYSQKLEEANRKAVGAVDKLSQWNREQKATIESSLEANKLALPEDVIHLLLNRLRDDLRLRSVAYYIRTETGGFVPGIVEGRSESDPEIINPKILEAIKTCHETLQPHHVPAPRLPADSIDDSGSSPLEGERLYFPLSTGINQTAVIELVARPGHRFDPDTIRFCRHLTTNMEVILKNKALYQETVRRSHELERINQISRSISGELDMDPLLRDVVEYTQHTTRAECALVGILEGGRLQIRHITPGVANVNEWVVDLNQNPLLNDLIERGKPLLVNDLNRDHRVLPDGFIWRNRFRSFVASPIVRKDDVLGVVCGFSRETRVFTTSDSYFLGLLASQVAIALDNARLFEEISARDKRRDHQLSMAQKLQKDRIPVFYKQNVAAVNCRLRPADELAGDFCDVFSLGRHSLAIVVGDVANKGVAASLMTFSLLSMFRNVAKTHKPPCEILESINRSLISQIKEDCWFATAFYGRLNTKNGVLTYASAGHERPIWYHADTGYVEMLEAAGYPLGLFKSFPYETREIVLKQGDRIILYTDGVTDAADAEGNRYGHNSLVDLVSKCGRLSCEDLTGKIMEEVEAFSSGARQKDDIIVTVLEMQDDPWIHKSVRFNDSNDLIGEILDALNHFELDRQTSYSIRLAIDEAFANAWRHGLKQRDDLPFEVSYSISDEGFLFRVKDPGEGFDHESLPDPTVEENLFKTSGRGVFLIRKMMDEVEFNDVGNEITVFKRFDTSESEDGSAYDALLLNTVVDLNSQQDSLEKAKAAEAPEEHAAVDSSMDSDEGSPADLD